MKLKHLLLVSFVILIIGLTAVSATDSDDTATTDNSGSDVAVDSSSSTTQATDTSTHTDSSVDKTSDASTTSSQKTDVTSQQTTQKVTEKTQTTSDTNAKTNSDSTSQSTQSTSQSTQTNSNTTQTSTNTVNEYVVDNSKSISTADDVSSDAASGTVWNITYIGMVNTFYDRAQPGDTFNFMGNFNQLEFTFGKNLTLTSFTSANFTDSAFTFVESASGSTVSNLYFDNSNSGLEAINITAGTSDMTITNNTIKVNAINSGYGLILLNNSNNINIVGNDISYSALYDYNASVINAFNSCSNVNITNNSIRINNTRIAEKGITLDNSENIKIDANSIVLNGSGANDNYAIGVFDSSSNVSIVNNTVKINGSTSTGKGITIDNSSYIVINSNDIALNDLYTNDTYAVGVLNSSRVDITDNNIKVNNSASIGKGIVFKDSSYSNVINNNVTVSALAINITYVTEDYEGDIDTCGVSILNSSLVNVTSNNINVSNSVKSVDLYSTVAAINVQGSVYSNRDTWRINISENNIFFKNDVYAYGIALHYNTNYIIITNNQIKTIDSTGYQVNAIDVSTNNYLTRINTNNINVSATGLAYGIGEMGSYSKYITSTVINFNNITVSANDSRAMELYYVNNTTVGYNNLYVYGNSTSGIGMGAVSNSTITYNNITTKGEKQEVSATYDSIPLITGGIYAIPLETYSYDDGHLISYDDVYNNIIKYNNIYTTGVYAVNLTGTSNTITFNYLTSNVTGNVLNGDQAVLVSGNGNTYTGNYGSTLSGEYQESDEEASTHIITEENYQFYFEESTSDGLTYQVTSGGLSDLVNDGDTLDIQGNITLTYKIAVDKEVNIISSTNDGMFIGDGDRIRLTITNSGSNTNVSDVTFYNMEFFTTGAYNLTIDHINITNVNVQGLGTNTGVFSLRGGSNFTVRNSYFYTEDNGGHSTVVLAGARNLNFTNNTIKAVGVVGNLFYVTTYNTESETTDSGVYVVNNTIIGPEIGSAICIAVALSGDDIYVANNFINYTGDGMRGQWTPGVDVSVSGTIFNNTIIGTGIDLEGANMINNTAKYITARGDNITVSGNTVETLSVNSTSAIVENNTIGTTSANSTSIDIIGSNITIENNNMLSENLILNINGSSNILNNNTITSNNIQLSINESNIITNNIITSENLILTINGSNNTFTNQQINGNTSYIINGSDNTIENNSGCENLQLNITGSNNILTNQQINGNISYVINGSDNTIENITGGENLQLNITGSNNILTNQQINGNVSYYIIGSDNTIENITGTIENLQITIIGSNYNIGNLEISGIASYNITGDNNSIINNTFELNELSNSSVIINGSNNVFENKISGNGDININITGSNNTFKGIETSGSTVFNVNGTENIIANNIFNGTDSLLRVIGSNNVIENNTLHKVSDSLSAVVYQGVIVISSDSNDNTVRYNDLYYYDGYRGSYTTGDDSVTVSDGATGNIVQDNYGNISEVVIPTPEEGTNYTYINYNVTSMSELISAMDDIKANGTYSNDTKYVINLLEGDYTITEAITWGGATSDVRDLIINGNGQVIDGKGSSSTFLTINPGYNLTFYNLTVSNFKLDFVMNPFMVLGNLNIYDCILDSPGMILAISPGSVNVNNTKMNDIILMGTSANITVTNSTISNTDTSSMTRIGIITNTGTTVFMNNNVSNITGQNIITSMDNTVTAYIENNVFSDINGSEDDIHFSFGEGSQVQGTIINNTFINGIKFDLKITDPTNVFIVDNNYINCSLPVNITGIEDTNITTEDYTTTITVSADSSYGANVDGKITIIINEKEYKTYDVVNGKANITIENSALNVLTNNIEIKYTSEDGSFENTTATFTITLTEDMIIRIPEGTLYSGDQITLTTQVAVNGSIAKDGYVIFKVNGKTVRDENGNPIMIQVDENGMASLNYTIPDTNSNEYNITAVYSGSEGIVRTNTTLTTTLKTATIVVNPITAKAGQTVTLTAYITDQNGQAVNSGKLIFKLNGKTLKDANGNTLYATINNGVATLNYTIPDNYSAKDYILTAVYQGTGFERSEANSTLTLTKSTPTIIPDSTVFGTNNTITITQQTESVNIKATIIDPETNAPIDTTTVVTIKINDKTVTQEYISNGQIDMTIYTSSFKNPTYNITVVVGENSQYERTSFNGTLEIVTPNGLATSSSYNGTLLVKED